MNHGVVMTMMNGFGKCGEKFERGVPNSMAICLPSNEATRLAGIFSWGKTLLCIEEASPAQKGIYKKQTAGNQHRF
jgi:hypothetical protein